MTSYIAICEGCGATLSKSSWTGHCPTCAESAGQVRMPASRFAVREQEDASPVPGYEILEAIGTGGMGSIHRGRQASLERDVAVKIILEDRVNEHDMDRFFREARVLAQLDHPNIVPIYDYGADAEGRCFYTMKMVRGRTLKAIIIGVRDGNESWTLERLLEVFRKVCDAVAFAHSRGVLHRDLKPENVMVGEFGEVLVMDWGLAGEIKGPAEFCAPCGPMTRGRVIDSDVELTMDGTVLGTPQYMSPEQANACTDLDERSDVYGLGGILYTILTLRPPLPKGTLDQMLESVRTGRIEPFRPAAQMTESASAHWHIPAALSAVVRKAMALDREDRFATAGALSADVEAHLAGYATSAEEMNVAGQLWLLIKRHRTVSIAAAVLLVVSAGFVARLVASERRATHSAQVAQQNETAAHTALAETQIALADGAYASNECGQMRAALDAVPERLRDTNWRYLNSRTDERQSQIEWEGDGFLIGSAPHPTEPGVFTAAAPGWKDRIITFDAKTGKVLRDFPHRGGWVRGIAYSPDGKLIALSRIDGEGISIHNAADGVEIRHWASQSSYNLAFLPDGKRLLQTAFRGCVLWDVETGREIWRAASGENHLPLSDGQRIVTVSEKHVRVLSAEDGSTLATYPVAGASPMSASVSPDGGLLVFAKLNGQLAGLRLDDGSTVFETSGGDKGLISRTGFMADGRRFVTVASLRNTGQTVQVCDSGSGRILRYLRGGTSGIESLSIHPLSGDLLITGMASATWSLPQSREPGWELVSDQIVGGFFGGDDLFLKPTEKARLVAFDLRTGAVAWQPSRAASMISTASADGLVGAVQVERWHDSVERQRIAADPAGAALVGKIGPNAHNVLIFRSEGESVRETGVVRFGTDVEFMSFNRDGSRLAMATGWGNIDTYRTTDCTDLPKLDAADIKFTMGMAWHGTNPQRLIGVFARQARRGTPNAEECLVSWDTDTGKRIAQMQSATPMNCLATESGGNRLAEAGNDKVVRIRDADTFALLHEFRAHDGPINAIAWNPKRPIIATGSADRSVRLWNADTGEFIEELHIGLREPSALYFSPSGKRLACVTPGEKTLIWELP